jgi:hypothetical protein
VNIDERFSVYLPPGANIKHFKNTNHNFVATDLTVIARHFDHCVIFLKFSVKELRRSSMQTCFKMLDQGPVLNKHYKYVIYGKSTNFSIVINKCRHNLDRTI